MYAFELQLNWIHRIIMKSIPIKFTRVILCRDTICGFEFQSKIIENMEHWSVNFAGTLSFFTSKLEVNIPIFSDILLKIGDVSSAMCLFIDHLWENSKSNGSGKVKILTYRKYKVWPLFIEMKPLHWKLIRFLGLWPCSVNDRTMVILMISVGKKNRDFVWETTKANENYFIFSGYILLGKDNSFDLNINSMNVFAQIICLTRLFRKSYLKKAIQVIASNLTWTTPLWINPYLYRKIVLCLKFNICFIAIAWRCRKSRMRFIRCFIYLLDS